MSNLLRWHPRPTTKPRPKSPAGIAAAAKPAPLADLVARDIKELIDAQWAEEFARAEREFFEVLPKAA
jgi:hypothetical protein